MIDPLLVIAGRQVFPSELPLIESIVSRHGCDGLRGMAEALCRQWCWERRGTLNVSGAERLLFSLAYRGLVKVPGIVPARPEAPPGMEGTPSAEIPLVGKLADFAPVRLCLVEDDASERVFDILLEQHHYLGRRRVIGEHLKYLAFIEERPVAVLLWGRAALKIGARDQFIGWSAEERRARLNQIASNYRFLILPWVHIRFLGSHVLALNMRVLAADWERRFDRKLAYLETFVDPDRFRATCYLAANWVAVGYTQGSGRRGPQYHFHGHRKLVLVYPLARHAGRSLDQQPRQTLHPRPLTVLPEPHVREGETAVEQSLSQQFNGQLDVKQIKNLVKELNSYCVRFYDLFHRSEPREHFGVAMRSLLSSLEKKNVEYMALKGGESVPVRTLQHFMSSSPWKDQEVRIRHQEFVAQTLGHPEGVLLVDGCDFPKKGTDSAGVARQYCGASGKIDNCQAGVFIGYARPDGMATLVDGQLYMPEKWFTPEQRDLLWDDCHIPSDLVFKTKPALALEMIHSITERGHLPVKYVVADEGYGNNPGFLDGMPEGVFYFCEVPKTTQVWPCVPEPPGSGAEQPPLDDAVQPMEVQHLVTQYDLEWRLGATIKEGAHGPLVADVARRRVARVRKVGQKSTYGPEVWLFLRINPTTGEHKYYLSSAPGDASMELLIWLSGMRWPVETCFQEGKDYLGMDHYQVRSWTGWHHHMTLTFLTHHFLTHLRLQGKKNFCSEGRASGT